MRSLRGRRECVRARLGFGIAALVFVLEQVTKWIVARAARPADQLGDQILPPFFHLTYTENHGISLGMFQARATPMRWVLVAVTAAIAIGVGHLDHA